MPEVELGSPELWAQTGGVIGLVLMALFILVIMFLFVNSRQTKSFQQFLAKKDELHQRETQAMVEGFREARAEDAERMARSSDRVADAIEGLTKSIQEGNSKE